MVTTKDFAYLYVRYPNDPRQCHRNLLLPNRPRDGSLPPLLPCQSFLPTNGQATTDGADRGIDVRLSGSVLESRVIVALRHITGGAAVHAMCARYKETRGFELALRTFTLAVSQMQHCHPLHHWRRDQPDAYATACQSVSNIAQYFEFDTKPHQSLRMPWSALRRIVNTCWRMSYTPQPFRFPKSWEIADLSDNTDALWVIVEGPKDHRSHDDLLPSPLGWVGRILGYGCLYHVKRGVDQP